MLEMQVKQVKAGGPTNEEMEYDDVFILDNVSVMSLLNESVCAC